jgi:hypothetical protein
MLEVFRVMRDRCDASCAPVPGVPPHCPAITLLLAIVYGRLLLVNMSFQRSYCQILANKGVMG